MFAIDVSVRQESLFRGNQLGKAGFGASRFIFMDQVFCSRLIDSFHSQTESGLFHLGIVSGSCNTNVFDDGSE